MISFFLLPFLFAFVPRNSQSPRKASVPAMISGPRIASVSGIAIVPEISQPGGLYVKAADYFARATKDAFSLVYIHIYSGRAGGIGEMMGTPRVLLQFFFYRETTLCKAFSPPWEQFA